MTSYFEYSLKNIQDFLKNIQFSIMMATTSGTPSIQWVAVITVALRNTGFTFSLYSVKYTVK